MARKFRISENQYNTLLGEGIDLVADVAAAHGDVKKAVDTTKQQAQKSGVKMDDANITIKASETNESKVISMKTLKENRLKSLKEKSQIRSLREFMRDFK